ncbi:hypothetical protein BpHYR1_002707 [Brachionus plicatilis]|uniref:Uncharacterized protein n=1 Tax=Brachionus plicatilis TaxID=10195 RepID=A0A3M7QH36_BRAPC|nr:hypothetical protein BpHYR1_002707 [Brachionus plicatilis]
MKEINFNGIFLEQCLRTFKNIIERCAFCRDFHNISRLLQLIKKSKSRIFLKFARSGFISKNLYTLGLSNAIDLPYIRILLQF